MAKQNFYWGQHHQNGETPTYVTVRQAAQMLGVHRNTVWTLIKDGKLPARRIGARIIRVEQADVLKMSKPYLSDDSEGAAQ